MHKKIAVVYNEPQADKYEAMGEAKAVQGVVEEVDAVRQALEELNYQVQLVPLSPPLESAVRKIGNLGCCTVVNLFEGFDGRPETEAKLAEELASAGYSVTGCPSEALALALDKAKAKDVLLRGGVPTPPHQALSPGNLDTFSLRFPCIVKPSGEDASHGLTEESLVNDNHSLQRQVERICRCYGGPALVEEFIGGREFNVTVLGNGPTEVLPPSEIEYSLPGTLPRILTFAAKWEPESVYFNHTKAVCPANIPEELKERIGTTAKQAYELLRCRGYARVDMRLDDGGCLMVLEVNPNPDISPGTGAARQALAAGLTYAGFIEKIIGLASTRVEA